MNNFYAETQDALIVADLFADFLKTTAKDLGFESLVQTVNCTHENIVELVPEPGSAHALVELLEKEFEAVFTRQKASDETYDWVGIVHCFTIIIKASECLDFTGTQRNQHQQ